MSNEPGGPTERGAQATVKDAGKKEEKPLRRKRGCFCIFGIIATSVLAIVVLAYMVWWQIEMGRFTSAIQELRDAGEPVDLADLALPTLADDENAATFYVRAFELLDGMSREKSEVLYALSSWKDNPSGEQVKQARALMEEYVEALELLRKGSRLENCRYDVDYDVSIWEIRVPHQDHLGESVSLLLTSSRVKMMDGRTEDAESRRLPRVSVRRRHISLRLKRCRCQRSGCTSHGRRPDRNPDRLCCR